MRIALFSLIAFFLVLAETNCWAQTTFEVVSSQIVVEHAGGMPAFCWAGNGDLLLAHATNWQPIPPAGGTVKFLRSKDGGKTWSKPKVVVRPIDPEKWSLHMWSGLHLMPDGSLILAYGQNHSEEVAHAYVIRSTDHGMTWGEPVRLADQKVSWEDKRVLVAFTEGFGRPVTAANGDVLVPIGARREGGFYGTKASAFVRTTDGGKTWGPLEFIATGTKLFGETSMGVTNSGQIIAILRCDTTRRVLWQGISRDHGRTWSKPERTRSYGDSRGYIHGKMPDMLCLPSGRLLLAIGSLNVGDGNDIWRGKPGVSYSGLYLSDDDGKTWRPDVLFPSVDPENLIAYDAPVLMAGRDGQILALSIQSDRRTRHDPSAGWTMGAHIVLHVIRAVAGVKP